MKRNPADTIREKVADPVCNMKFAVEKAVASTYHAGVTYYFCTEACKKQFIQNPERYVGSR